MIGGQTRSSTTCSPTGRTRFPNATPDARVVIDKRDFLAGPVEPWRALSENQAARMRHRARELLAGQRTSLLNAYRVR